MKNNKIIKYAIIITIFLLISISIELLVFNFKSLFLIKNKSIEDITDKIIYDINDNSNLILIKLDKKDYIGRIIINYKSNENIKINILKDNDEENEIGDTLNYKFNKTSIKINKDIKTIKISYTNSIENLNIKKISIDNTCHISYIRIIFIFSILICGLILYIFFQKGGKTEKIHKVFFLLFTILGTNIILSQPNTCFYSFDDQIHYENTVNLIKFQRQLPLSDKYVTQHLLFNDINSFDDIKKQDKLLNNNNEIYTETFIMDSNIYNKVGYFPSAIGILIGRILHFPFTICFKLGKIFNMLAYGLIMAYAINKVKIGKRLLTIISFLPSNLFLSTQYSYDPAVTAGLTLAFVLLLNIFIDKKEKINLKWMIIFLMSILYASFVKAVYVPLILLFLFIPKERFENDKICKKVKFGIIVILLLVMATFVLPSVSGEMLGDVRGGNTSISLQLQNIIHSPFNYIIILKNTMVLKFFYNFFSSSAIGNMAYLGNVEGNLYYLIIGLLLFTWITDNEKIDKKLNIKTRILIILDVLFIILLIWTALYLSFTPVGLNTINGVQARYFLPLLFPLFIVLNFNKIKNNYSMKKYNTIILVIISLINIMLIYNIFILSFGV